MFKKIVLLASLLMSASVFAEASFSAGVSHKVVDLEVDFGPYDYDIEGDTQVANLKTLFGEGESRHSIDVDFSIKGDNPELDGLAGNVGGEIDYFRFASGHHYSLASSSSRIVGFAEKAELGNAANYESYGVHIGSTWNFDGQDWRGKFDLYGNISHMDVEGKVVGSEFNHDGVGFGLGLGTDVCYKFGRSDLCGTVSYSFQSIIDGDSFSGSDGSDTGETKFGQTNFGLIWVIWL